MNRRKSPIIRRALLLVALIGGGLGAYYAFYWGPLGFYYATEDGQPAGYAGSASCRPCHEKFYALWSPSHHGQAMVEFTPELAKRRLSPLREAITIGQSSYLVQWDDQSGWLTERNGNTETRYAIRYAMGGKNIYYLLAPLERGKLQVLPLAYDLNRKEWYDMAASGSRHFTDEDNEVYHWKDWPYTFNTACYNCHVSQLETNYDVVDDAYETAWSEPGINCETCHGPSESHNRLFMAAPEGFVPKDTKITVVSAKRGATVEQVNDACATCHAKFSPVAIDYQPGDHYFDHYDLVTLESRDFYPDGRDLGENYSFTLWRMSPCAKSGKLDCLYCHTSSGRYRFKSDESEKANQACAPCHKEQAGNVAGHSHHSADKPGVPTCVDCHMPMTEFARMRRTDHSMRPPMPAATLAFKSPNACNLCHKKGKEDAAWADAKVREWHKKDYQASTLAMGRLIEAARREDWSRVPEMLAYMGRKDRDEVFTSSLVRLLIPCPEEEAMPVMVRLLKNDPSPLVRSSAARYLGNRLSREALASLATACADPVRLVRVRAGAALSAVPADALPEADRSQVARAVDEYLTSLRSRPDDGFGHYNLGNYYLGHAQLAKALAAYDTAHRLRPDSVMPLVNASLVLSRLGRNDEAEARLRKALDVEPRNAVALTNLGMLLVELGRPGEAESTLRAALKSDPKSAQAAYNLGLMLVGGGKPEGIEWLRAANGLSPTEPRYAYALAFYVSRDGEMDEAAAVLRKTVEARTAGADNYGLLGQIYEKQDKAAEAAAVYREAARNESLSPKERASFGARLPPARAP